MIMTAADIKKYPKTAYYVRVNILEVARVPSIMRAFKTIGGISRATLLAALKWEQGPSIKIMKLVNASGDELYGEFSPGKGSKELRIGQQVVAEFEAGKGRRVARAGNVYLLGVTILHEAMHWADDQDGVQRVGEDGNDFEIAMYGSIIV